MITRALTLVAGISGAAASSQFPEFSQQYMQRLGGAVDELARQIERYDQDASDAGLDLTALLAGMAQEGPLAEQQADNIQADIDRHAQLSSDLAALEGAGPFSRLGLVSHLGDREIAARAMEQYKPAMPVTFEGAIFAGSGFLAGWAGVAAVLAFLSGAWATVFGRRKRRPT